MDILSHDLRLALRSLVRRPGLTAVAVLTLSLGVGASTSMFTLLHGVVIQPLPFPDSDRIVRLYTTSEDGDQRDNWSGANFVDLRAQATSYEAVAGFVNISYSVHESGFPTRIRGASVTPAFFQVFGVQPLAGRTLDTTVDTPDGERVVVLGHALWSSRFGADQALVGKPLELNGDSYTVVGVMPHGFSYPGETQLWVAARYRSPDPPVPIGEDPAESRGAEYFHAVARLRGRSFTAADGPDDAPVAVVSQAFAEQFFPGEDPIGQRIAWNDPEAEGFEWSTVVGVVGNTRLDGLDAEPRIEAYQPMAQAPLPFMTLVLQTTVPPGTLTEPLRRAVMEVSPTQPVERIRTMALILHDSLARQRFSMMLLWVFAGLAVALAVVGLYGVMSFSVAQRSREIGVRMAMGADRGRIHRLVLSEAGRLLAVGLVAGLAATLVLGRLITGFLFQVRPLDPIAFAVAVSIVSVATLIAAWIPASRASRRNPMATLRSD